MADSLKTPVNPTPAPLRPGPLAMRKAVERILKWIEEDRTQAEAAPAAAGRPESGR